MARLRARDILLGNPPMPNHQPPKQPLVSLFEQIDDDIAGVRDLAFDQASIYATTAAGIAATTVGQTFSVASSDPAVAFYVYRHTAGGVATKIADTPSIAVLGDKASQADLDDTDAKATTAGNNALAAGGKADSSLAVFGAETMNATRYGTGWSVSWLGVAGRMFGSAVTVADLPLTTLASGEVLYFDKTSGVLPYPVVKATAASVASQLAFGTYVELLRNQGGALSGKLAHQVQQTIAPPGRIRWEWDSAAKRLVMIHPYGPSEMLRLTIEPAGVNGLPQVAKVETAGIGDPRRVVWTVVQGGGVADWWPPLVVRAAANGDGAGVAYTGGNHGSAGDATGDPTATLESLTLAVDGADVRSGAQWGSASEIVMTWSVALQGYNTRAAGRNIARQQFTARITPQAIETLARVSALEAILVERDNGPQAEGEGYLTALHFWGGSQQGKISGWSTAPRNSGAMSAWPTSLIAVASGTHGHLALWLDPAFGVMANAAARDAAQPAMWSTTVPKLYMQAVVKSGGLALASGESYEWRGGWSFAPTAQATGAIEAAFVRTRGGAREYCAMLPTGGEGVVRQLPGDLGLPASTGLPSADGLRLAGVGYSPLIARVDAALPLVTSIAASDLTETPDAKVMTAAEREKVTGVSMMPVPPVDGVEVTFYIRDGVAIPLWLGADGMLRVVGSEVAGMAQRRVVAPGFTMVWPDGDGRVAVGLGDDGVFHVASLRADKINGEPVGEGMRSRDTNGARLLHEVNYICGYGQSLGEGSTPAVALTTAQEYDLVGFPARNASPSGWVPLTVANTQWGTRGESPLYGTLGSIKRLIEAEHALPYTEDNYLLVGGNCAVSGQSIANLSKGTSYYANVIGQVAAAHTIAMGQGRTMACPAITYTQGEGDFATDADSYASALKQLAEDIDADIRGITGQAIPTLTITYQTATRTLDLAQAQLLAALEHPLIVQACPIYQMTYGDELHITAASAQWLGGYYGLAYKRAVIDGRDFVPLQPVGHAVNGTVLDLIFNRTGLTFDITTIPQVTDFGFSVRDAVNAPVAISAISIIAPNRVRLELAQAVQPGWAVEYGRTATGRADAFTGLAGNLRDSAGDVLTYKGHRLDNWCMLNHYQL